MKNEALTFCEKHCIILLHNIAQHIAPLTWEDLQNFKKLQRGNVIKTCQLIRFANHLTGSYIKCNTLNVLILVCIYCIMKQSS